MPTDPSGNYSLPPGYFAQAGTAIRTEQHNPIFEDVAQGLSQRLMRDGRNGMVGALDMGTFPIRNLAPGANPTDAATLGQGVPIGAVMDYALNNAPAGWLLCFGQALASDTEFPLLRAALIASGSPYGSSGGNPLIPDVRGRAIAGLDAMGGTAAGRLNTATLVTSGLGGTGGAQTINLTISQMPAHNHGGSTGLSGAHSHNVERYGDLRGTQNVGGTNTTWNGSSSVPTSTEPPHLHDIPSEGSGDAVAVIQPTIVMNKIIRAAY